MKTPNRLFVRAFIFSLCLLTSCTRGPVIGGYEAREFQLPIPRLKPYRTPQFSAGSGFFVSRQGDIVTNAHVVQGCANIRVLLSDQSVRVADQIGLDQDLDLVLLRVTGEIYGVAEFPKIDKNLLIAGYPATTVAPKSPALARGTVLSTQGDDAVLVVRVSEKLGPGSSGGPILDPRGFLIGMVRGRDSQSATTILAIPAWAIRRFLNERRIRYRKTKNIRTNAVDEAELELRARNMTVRIECSG